ncbi:MAG: hypothetical protein ACYDDI_17580 [Candidatus Acidiferrales bacterium]
MGLAGGILITVGVAGEFWFTYEASRVETKLRENNRQIEQLLNKEAGDAKTSAEGAALAASRAKSSAGEVAKEVGALTARIGSASRQLDKLEQDMLAQGPRWRLLQNGEATFVKTLKPFAGQRVTIVTCANDDTERFALEERLVSSLFPKAGWDKPGWTRWAGCPIMLTGGNEIFFVAATFDSAEWTGMPAQQWTKPVCGRFNISDDAANALCDVLNKLKIFTLAFEEKPLPEDVGIHNARLFFGNGVPDGPAEMAYKDPGRIFLLIGPSMPMFTNRNKLPHKSVKPK